MSTWTQAGENLVRHENGTYYLRAKIGGRVIRESLRLTDLRLAKIKRDARLAALRAAAELAAPRELRTLRDALAVLRHDLLERPDIRPKTRTDCANHLRILRETLPLSHAAKDWTRQEAATWWLGIGRRYSPSVANKLHGLARKLAAILIERHVRADDPTRELRRMPLVKTRRELPGREEMAAIVAAIRGVGKRGCVESARMVAFLAYSGLRKGELAALRWEHVGEQWLTVGADGQTKGKSFRMVPISAPLAALVAEMRAENSTGPVFYMASPRRALHSACAALGLPELRVHDLRHYFATWAIESGVDVPTVAKWLGHKDGGALAMRTYGHVRDSHSLAAIQRLS